MGKIPAGRLVSSTEIARSRPKCGWPAADCRCAATLAAGAEPVPEKITVKLRLESRGPGKHVTVIDGLPDNRAYLADLCRSLKKACGAGGAAAAGAIELQGDQRERLHELLSKKGWTVKG
jgi:translation initiation factor 1